MSTDPGLEVTVRDVAGLYLNPRRRPSWCAWVKNPRSRRWNTPPHAAGPARHPQKRNHGYIRHGTTTLVAALEIATGKVTDAC